MKRACVVAVAGLVLCGALPASAQDQLVTTSARDAERRWDVVGFTGWRGVNKSDIAPDWDRWYDVAAFGVSTSRHLTRHVKLDVDLSTTSIGRVDDELFNVPGLPYYELRQYQFRRTSLATALAYQFFENRWVHPFLGVGLEGVRETERLEVDRVPVRGGVLSAVPATTRIAYGARPFITGGFKFYVSERGFIRTDVRSTLSSGGVESAAWRVGAGVDF